MKWKNKPKPRTLKGARQTADSLWSLAIRKKWGRQCDVCGKRGTDAHHFLSKHTNPCLRYSLNTGVMLCYRCHRIMVHSYGDPITIEKIIEKRGRDWYDSLLEERKKQNEAGGSGCRTKTYYLEKIDELWNYLNLNKKE